MFKPNEIEHFSMMFDEQMKALENQVMEDIVRRIRINGEITRSADWQINRLVQFGMSKKDIENALKTHLKISDDIREMYENVIEEGYARDNDIYNGAGIERIPFEENDELQQLISATAQQTGGEMKNISQSLGFAVKGKNGKLEFTPLAEYYQNTLDSAISGIASGVFDYNTVLKRVVSELTNSGLRTVEYASGRSSRIEVAARRSVMTGLSQLTAKVNESNAEELGTDMFETTWHSGARPEHQVWQGRWYTKKQLVSVCGLGSVTGLCGANCYHGYFPVIPGLSEPTYTEEQLSEMNRKENTPTDYYGREYTKYEALQRQRRLETAMRAQRQKIHLLKVGGADEDDIITARCRYRGTSQEYTRFSKAMNLPQQRERVTVDGLGDVGRGKWKINKDGMSKQKEYKRSIWSKTATKISEEEYNSLIKHAEEKGVKLVSFKNFDGDVELIREIIDNANIVLQDFPRLAEGKSQLQIHNSFNMDDDDFAQTINNKIFINNFAFRSRQLLSKEYGRLAAEKWFVSGTDYTSIIYHELGHAVSNVYGLSSMKIAKEVTGLSNREIIEYVKHNLSEYSSKSLNGSEIISEVFSSVYSKTNNSFALKFYMECVRIILERGGV